jgi:alpha-1,2-mannosyltransferase
MWAAGHTGMGLLKRLGSVLRDGAWINAARVTAYSIILLVVFTIVGAAWVWQSNGLIDPQGTPFGSDFISFWAASSLTLDGQPAAAYRLVQHHAAEQAAVGHAAIPYFAFFYPPIFLLICWPLALLPYAWALLAWLLATGSAYFCVLRRIVRMRGAALPILAFPAVLLNVTHGQNGFLTTALFGGALMALDRRPIAAGILFGGLVYKPHLGLLIPLALIAGGRWKTLAAACLTVTGLALASLLVFGVETWMTFWAGTGLARDVLDRNLVGFEKMQSVFAATRLLGASNALAYSAQAVVTLGVAILVGRVWHRRPTVAAAAIVLVVGALLATPFLLDYDLILLALPIALIANEGLSHGFLPYEKTVLVLAFVLPLVSRLAASTIGLPVAPLVLGLFFLLGLRRAGLGGRVGEIAAAS